MPCFLALTTLMALAGAVVSKPMPKKTTSLSGILLGDAHRFDGGIDHAHIPAGSLDRKQILLGTGHAQHVAVRGEDDILARGDGNGFIHQFQRGDAYRTAGAVNEFDLLGQQVVQSRTA